MDYLQSSFPDQVSQHWLPHSTKLCKAASLLGVISSWVLHRSKLNYSMSCVVSAFKKISLVGFFLAHSLLWEGTEELWHLNDTICAHIIQLSYYKVMSCIKLSYMFLLDLSV